MGCHPRQRCPPPTRTRPAQGRRARPAHRLARLRRRRRRAPRRLRRLRRGRRSRATACARGCAAPSATTPRRARSRSSSPRADRIPARAPPSGRALAGPPLRAPARGQGRSGGRCAAPHRARSTASTWSPSCRPIEQWRYRNKLEYSFGTGRGRRPGVRLPRRGVAGSASSRWPTTCWSPSAPTPCASPGRGLVPRRGPGRPGSSQRRGLPAQPRHPRGAAHRAAPGAPGHLARRAARRGAGRAPSRPTACCGPGPTPWRRPPRAARPS